MIYVKNKRYKPKWKNILLLTIGIIALAQLVLGKVKTYQSPYGEYQCRGGIIKVCGSESQEVYRAYGR